MIKVKHKNKVTLQEFQSDFATQADYEQHQLEHPEMYEPTCEVSTEDLTAQVEHEKKVDSQAETRKKCWALIDEIGVENKGADDSKMDAIFMNPSFVAVAVALMTGAPKTARRYVQSIGPSLYSSDKVAEIVSKLDAIIAASEG